ncbi:MAG: radical SAM protein [Chloroflexi bacterium]|nr:radical SAM protein [Chloroflexota bacterium]
MIIRKRYAPGYCSYQSGYSEIRWDVLGCNLGCQFCWSPASRPEQTREPSVQKSTIQIFQDTLNAVSDPSKTFIRFTGGEPTLYWGDVSCVLDMFDQDNTINQIPVLIQTNGIEIGRRGVSVDELVSHSKQLYLFELSFKGTNQDEFALLTTKESELYQYQLKAYEILANLSQRSNNVRVVAVLGIYHSAIKSKSKYAFVNPTSGAILFENVSAWNPKFKEIWDSAQLKWVEPLRMSPKGVWKNLHARCGPSGSDILMYYSDGANTNRQGLFPMKPKSVDYARLIVQREFW